MGDKNAQAVQLFRQIYVLNVLDQDVTVCTVCTDSGKERLQRHESMVLMDLTFSSIHSARPIKSRKTMQLQHPRPTLV